MTRTRPARVWAILVLTLFSAGAASSGASEAGRRSPIAIVLLVLAAVLVYALIAEVDAQGKLGATVRSRWTWRAAANALVLGGYAVLASAAAIFGYVPTYERVSGAILGPLYAVLCAYLVLLRHRALSSGLEELPSAGRP